MVIVPPIVLHGAPNSKHTQRFFRGCDKLSERKEVYVLRLHDELLLEHASLLTIWPSPAIADSSVKYQDVNLTTHNTLLSRSNGIFLNSRSTLVA